MQSDYGFRLTKVEERSKSNTHQIAELKRQQSDLSRLLQGFAKLESRQESIEKDVSEIKEDVKLLTAKPARRWDMLMEKLLSAAAGAIVTLWMLGSS